MINADPAPPLAAGDLTRAIDAARYLLERHAEARREGTGVLVGPQTLRILLAAADQLAAQTAPAPAPAPPDPRDDAQEPTPGSESSQGRTADHPCDASCPICHPWWSAIDAAHIARQREFSARTFGPGLRLVGLLDHIHKELAEIEADPGDVLEWADLIILAIDGAWRAGHEPQAIIDAVIAKQVRNEKRTWPDWRTADPNRAIEHDRQGEVA